MTNLNYQDQFVLDGVSARAGILNLTARHNRSYAAGNLTEWVMTFKHTGATYTRSGEHFTNVRKGFDGGGGRRLVTVDHDITVDGVFGTQICVALMFVGIELQSIGTYVDQLIYERGGWYFASRQLDWDSHPAVVAGV